MGPFPLTDAVKNALYAGWTDQNSINGDWAANGAQKYQEYITQGKPPVSNDPAAIQIQNRGQQIAASDAYKAATDTAISGLQTQKGNLGQQYSDLLKTVNQEYQPLINQETATAGAAESGRGLTPDSQLFQQQVQGALQPVYGAEAANAQQLGQGSIADINALTTNIASLQAGVAGTSMGIPLQYSQLALQQAQNPAQIALLNAQAQQVAGANPTQIAIQQLANQFQNVAPGNNLVNTLNNFAVNPSMLTSINGGAAWINNR